MEKFGPNKSAEGEQSSRLKILRYRLANPLIYLLLITSVVTLLLDAKQTD